MKKTLFRGNKNPEGFVLVSSLAVVLVLSTALAASFGVLKQKTDLLKTTERYLTDKFNFTEVKHEAD